MLTIDANVWIAAFDPADCFHGVSATMLRRAASGNFSLYAPDIAQLEVACAVSRRRRDPAAGVAAGSKLAAHPVLRMVLVDTTLQAAALRIGTQCFLRGADALYAAAAELTGSVLISWDKELVSRSGGLTPTDWLIANP
ncbi:MAG: Ribonuclease VapC [Verrucomicrobiaceae bacterium]|nr:Ribonuclease VapC [Verrucomicrobiaceae bacterium]